MIIKMLNIGTDNQSNLEQTAKQLTHTDTWRQKSITTVWKKTSKLCKMTRKVTETSCRYILTKQLQNNMRKLLRHTKHAWSDNKRCKTKWGNYNVSADRWSPPHPQLLSGQRRVAGEKRHLQAALLHLLHVGQLGPLPVLRPPALPAVGLLLLAAAGDLESQNRRPSRLR